MTEHDAAEVQRLESMRIEALAAEIDRRDVEIVRLRHMLRLVAAKGSVTPLEDIDAIISNESALPPVHPWCQAFGARIMADARIEARGDIRDG